MNTKVALGATAALALGGMVAEPASAMTFTVNAQTVNLLTNTSFGSVTGSFDFSGGSFSNINISSELTGTTYTALSTHPMQTSNGNVAFFKDTTNTLLKLAFSSNLGLADVGDTVELVGGASLNSLEQSGFSFVPVSGSVTAVPTPALLPGLVGMGLAALRRKKAEEAVEENA